MPPRVRSKTLLAPLMLAKGAVLRQRFHTQLLEVGATECMAAKDGTEVAVAHRAAKYGNGLAKSWKDRAAKDFRTSIVPKIEVLDWAWRLAAAAQKRWAKLISEFLSLKFAAY